MAMIVTDKMVLNLHKFIQKLMQYQSIKYHYTSDDIKKTSNGHSNIISSAQKMYFPTITAKSLDQKYLESEKKNCKKSLRSP